MSGECLPGAALRRVRTLPAPPALAARLEERGLVAPVPQRHRLVDAPPRLRPVTDQLAAILERRRAAAVALPAGAREWVLLSPTSATGHVPDPHHLYARIGKAGGAKFWFHGLRNSFITVAERELMLPPSLTKRLVNHARPNDVTQGYAADWTIAQLREPAQKTAERIQALMCAERAA